MPPKILIRTAFTLYRLADFECMRHCSELAPPRHLESCRHPPAYLMMSIVAIASPAPFTMQPTLPSSLM